jgi:hypothetical protein
LVRTKITGGIRIDSKRNYIAFAQFIRYWFFRTAKEQYGDKNPQYWKGVE